MKPKPRPPLVIRTLMEGFFIREAIINPGSWQTSSLGQLHSAKFILSLCREVNNCFIMGSICSVVEVPLLAWENVSDNMLYKVRFKQNG